MPNEKNRFTCLYPDCDKPATRVLGGDHVGIGEIGRVFQPFVFQPKDVQAHLVAHE